MVLIWVFIPPTTPALLFVTSADLANAVASFMQRNQSTFVRYGFDCLVRAMNNARLFAERQIDFELARVSAQVSVDLVNGASLDTATLLGTATPVSVKKITRPFLRFGTNADALPVHFQSRDSWLFRLKRLWEGIRPPNTPTFTSLAEAQYWAKDVFGLLQQYTIVQFGRTIYVVPNDQKTLGANPIVVPLDIHKWLSDYGTTTITGSATDTVAGKLVASGGNFIVNNVRLGTTVRNTTTGASAAITSVDSATQLGLSADIFVSGNAYSISILGENDFLLDYCFDWLMYRSIWELNYFLKEDERVVLSQALIDSAWEAVKQWNQNLINHSVDDVDLA